MTDATEILTPGGYIWLARAQRAANHPAKPILHNLTDYNTDPGDWITGYPDVIKWANLQMGEIAHYALPFVREYMESSR